MSNGSDGFDLTSFEFGEERISFKVLILWQHELRLLVLELLVTRRGVLRKRVFNTNHFFI